MGNASLKKALFLDRDGVINQEIHYLHRAEDVRWVDGIFALCRAAQVQHYKVVIVTNQAGIARGFYTMEDFNGLMGWMRQQFQAEQITLDGVYHCPFHPEGIGEFRGEHEDRKPLPGMLLRAARDLDLDLGESLLIGDRCTDIAAARAAGLRQALLLAGTESGSCPHPHRLIHTLAEAEAFL
jgi:D-glycero-D-manno-heptose 1,7-bisphosphate phosphatase